MTEKNEFVENVRPANSALFIYVRPISWKQLNSLLTINTLSWLSSTVVSGLGARGPGFNYRLRQGFLCLIFCFVVVVFLLFFTKVCKSLCNDNLIRILNILQDLWLIIRVLRYRPSIFKLFIQRQHLELRLLERFTIFQVLHFLVKYRLEDFK